MIGNYEEVIDFMQWVFVLVFEVLVEVVLMLNNVGVLQQLLKCFDEVKVMY